MRLDRFITLNLVQPFRRGLCGDSSLVTRHSSLVTPLPILMYHSISDDPEPGVRPYYRVCTGPQCFREQMQWLKDNGYQCVTLSAGLAWLNSNINSLSARSAGGEGRSELGGNSHCPASAFGHQPSAVSFRPVVLTFDDGFRDFYTHAFPILQQQGFLATMYLPTAYISDSSCHVSHVTRHAFHGKECLAWNEIHELHRAGIEFGSHTVHHPELVDLPWPDIQSEIADSKAQIENQLGAPVKAFAYPYAFPQTRRDFVGRLKDLLTAGGYETCVTTQIGRHRPGADPLQIKRLPVNSGDDDKLFQAKLEGGYDWLANGQAAVKSLKRLKSLRFASAN